MPEDEALPVSRRAPGAALLVAALAAVSVVACDTGGATAPPDRFIEGINFTELFAPPRPEELQAVRADWEARQIEAIDVAMVAAALIEVGSVAFEVRVYSHLVDGDLHYGAVAVPTGAAAGAAPVLLYTHFGQEGAFQEGLSVETALVLLALAGGLREDMVYAFPAYRSQYLRLNGATYRAGGLADPWDGQVDDALAFLEVVRQEVPEADTGRIVGLGMSSGGAVALLAAIRDPGIDGVVGFFAPTDFLGPFLQDVFERALLGESRNPPGFAYLQSEVLTPLRRGDLSVAEVRLELIRRSAIYFVERLPELQIHHGTDDPIVPVSQTRALEAALQRVAQGAPWEVFIYEGGTHNPLTLPLSADRAARFVDGITGGAPRARRIAVRGDGVWPWR